MNVLLMSEFSFFVDVAQPADSEGYLHQQSQRFRSIFEGESLARNLLNRSKIRERNVRSQVTPFGVSNVKHEGKVFLGDRDRSFRHVFLRSIVRRGEGQHS